MNEYEKIIEDLNEAGNRSVVADEAGLWYPYVKLDGEWYEINEGERMHLTAVGDVARFIEDGEMALVAKTPQDSEGAW